MPDTPAAGTRGPSAPSPPAREPRTAPRLREPTASSCAAFRNKRVYHCPVFLHQIGFGGALHVVRGHLVIVLELGKQLAPVAVVDVIGAQLNRESRVAAQLADQLRA